MAERAPNHAAAAADVDVRIGESGGAMARPIAAVVPTPWVRGTQRVDVDELRHGPPSRCLALASVAEPCARTTPGAAERGGAARGR